MRMFLVVLAASLVGADRPDDGGAGSSSTMIRYRARVLEMEGLAWRSSLQAQLQPVARRESATIWTAARETANAIAEKAARVETAPNATCAAEVRARIFRQTTVHFVGDMGRQADGPVNHATLVGFVPRLEDAVAGYSCEVAGRALDQGVLARVKIDDRQIVAFHTFPLRETLEASSKSCQDAEPTHVQATIQVPEYARTTVGGEWLIPKDGALVISLGVHTTADAKGQAVVRERIAVIEAESQDAKAEKVAASPTAAGSFQVRWAAVSVNHGGAGNNEVARAEIPLPNALPTLPGRCLPQPFDPNGMPAALPPLPDDEAPVTMLPGTQTPIPSPQVLPSPSAIAGEPMPWRKSQIRDTTPPGDDAARRAGYTEIRPCPAGEASDAINPPAVPTPDQPDQADFHPAPPPVDGEPLRFTLPLGGNLRMEVDLRARPSDGKD